jgi:hypothetical protein
VLHEGLQVLAVLLGTGLGEINEKRKEGLVAYGVPV